jgi:hypothetical protein
MLQLQAGRSNSYLHLQRLPFAEKRYLSSHAQVGCAVQQQSFGSAVVVLEHTSQQGALC